MQSGSISINAQNIMPVIKRWLYSDKDIFIRELVSNGCDAITKLTLLDPSKKDEDLRVTVTVDADKGEIRFCDNGIGMTDEEVEKYINQVAFSSAEEFLKNYSGDAGEDKGGIIGHFGLGFYSAFMASDKVTIDTLSYKEGAKPVRWESADGMQFEMDEGTRDARGTTVTLHIMDEEKEFLDGYRVREVLERYCGYMAVPIYLVDLKQIEEDKKRAEEAKKNKKKDDAADDAADEAPEQAKPINNTHPLWLKAPKDCTEDEYKQTYREVFHTYEDPLFWVHLNVDYPFNLKGILYFPRIKKDFGGQEGEIKLFNRQVFVAANIKEVIPEFLMLLKGVIDCPDLPLNVSRSFLQNDGYVKKLSAHITKKVADRLNGLFNTERDNYQTYWDDIHPFVKYGCLRDSKFFDSVKGSLLLKTTEGAYYTFDEYKARNEGKVQNKILYTTDADRQAASVAMYQKQGVDVAVMDTMIDMSFMNFMEYSAGEDAKVTFARVDADVTALKGETDEGKDIDVKTLETLVKGAMEGKEVTVKLEALADPELPLLLVEDEQSRRFREMSAVYGQDFPMPEKYTAVFNRACPAVRALAAMEEGDISKMICSQMLDLARLSSRPLEAADLRAFLSRSNELLSMLLKNE